METIQPNEDKKLFSYNDIILLVTDTDNKIKLAEMLAALCSEN